jgi:hyperosmotically inducible protein
MSLAWALAAGLGTSAAADSPDGWITTKAKIALLTAHDVSVTAVNVDTVNGAVTLHGKVKTEGEKERAAAAVRTVDGVKSVRNLLQVVPEGVRESVKVADDAIKKGVEDAIKANATLDDVKVASVNNGVVLLSGKTTTLAEKLRAIELAWNVSGVQRVSSVIEAGER